MFNHKKKTGSTAMLPILLSALIAAAALSGCCLPGWDDGGRFPMEFAGQQPEDAAENPGIPADQTEASGISTETGMPEDAGISTETETPKDAEISTEAEAAKEGTDRYQDIVLSLDSGELVIPAYARYAYTVVNGNVPFFAETEDAAEAFESYSELDALGRCGTAYACIGEELMPTEERESIGSVKPTAWQTSSYDFIEGNLLYNRCHLIGYQLTGENANERNLITGTRYFNVTGMEPFESRVASYIKSTGNHVRYRVTPVFTGDNLLADGVLMEAESVEDRGEGVRFCVFVYNVQPGIGIDYETGENWLVEQEPAEEETLTFTYILNTRSMKFHLPACDSVVAMSEHNKQEYTGTREELIAEGYSPCKNCNP